MEGQPLFDMNINKNFSFDWSAAIPSNYKGLLLPDTHLSTITGGFGDMVFQSSLQKGFAIWYNHYDIKRRFKSHVSLDRPIIELSLILESDMDCVLNPLGHLKPRRWQYNLMYAPYMDSQVQFESYSRGISVDVHLDISFLEDLMGEFSDLVEPFLEAVYAGAPTRYFPEYVYASAQMVHTVQRILRLLTGPGNHALLLECLVIFLLIQAMELKYNGHYCPMRYDKVIALGRMLDCGIQLALSDLTRFDGTAYYAQKSAMSATTFKKYMRLIKGGTIRKIWQCARLESIFRELLQSDKVMTTIASEHGFSTYGSFRSAFKNRFGIYPSDLRKLQKQ